MPSRQLSDRIETYEDIIPGKCSCGEKVHKVLKSNCTMWVKGYRYHYPGENTAWCIFRCRNCHKPIHQTFIAEIMICIKKSFETPDEAQKRANEINKKNESNGDKTKLRPYKCKKCGKMHISSMHKKHYQATKDIPSRNAMREKRFIKQEAEYWENKFNK